MSKVYIFAIGGTGSRVLRSLTMLLSTGVECNADAVVPIIIDPDATLEDLTRTSNLMRNYNIVREQLSFSDERKNGFFRTEIKETIPNFRLMLNNTSNMIFRDYINLEGMTDKNKALAKMLFSEKNLNSDMTEGFKGHPNIGSVVLHHITETDEFISFTNEFNPGDRIFIISSIFGGTGAAGFPVLLKTLRTSDKIMNHDAVNKAPIGAITVLPYFKVKADNNSEIDSSTFISKTKSALSYYHRTLSGIISSLYYVADNCPSTYDNHEGGNEQKNNAHFVELISALAIIDFCRDKRQQHDSPIFKEFGITDNVKEIIFSNLGARSKRTLQKPMTQFQLFARYFSEYQDYLTQSWTKNCGIDQTFCDGDFMDSLKKIHADYKDWLTELGSQERKFTPFDLQGSPNQLFNLVKGLEPRWRLKKNYNLYNDRLNSISQRINGGNPMQQLVELFYLATEKLVNEKLKIQ